MEQGLGYILAIMAEYVSILEGIGFLAGEMLVYHEPTGATNFCPRMFYKPIIIFPQGLMETVVDSDAGSVKDIHRIYPSGGCQFFRSGMLLIFCWGIHLHSSNWSDGRVPTYHLGPIG